MERSAFQRCDSCLIFLDLGSGMTFVAAYDACVFPAPHSWKVLYKISQGTRVTVAGCPKSCDGDVMVRFSMVGCVPVPQAVKNVMVPCQSSLPLLVGHEHTRDIHEIWKFEVLQLYTGLYINSLDHVWLGKNIGERIGLWSFRVNFWFLHAQVPIEPKAPPTCRERGREWLQEWVSKVEKVMARDGLTSWTSPSQGSHQLKYRRKSLQSLKSLRQARDLLRRLPVDLAWEGTWKISPKIPKRPKEGLQVSFVTTYYWQIGDLHIYIYTYTLYALPQKRELKVV